MDKYLISFELFKARTGFNPYLIINRETSYEEFSKYLRRRKVFPPSIEEFKKYYDNKFLILEPEENIPEIVEVKKEEVKPKRRRRKKSSTTTEEKND